MRWAVSLVLLAVLVTAALPLIEGLREVVDRRPPAAAASAAAPLQGPTPDREAGGIRVVPAEVVVVYRWRDEKGTVHFETGPPPEGVEAEVIEMRRPAKAALGPGDGAAGTGAAGTGASGTGGTGAGSQPQSDAPFDGEPFRVYTPGGMDELLRRLDGTLDSLGERERTMRELEEDL